MSTATLPSTSDTAATAPATESTVQQSDHTTSDAVEQSTATAGTTAITSDNTTVTTDAADYDAKLTAQLLRQLEFYFSNSNLPKDKFLKQVYDTNDGYVDLKTLMSFKRMQTLTTNLHHVIHAVQQSKQLKLNTDHSAVTRVQPLPNVVSTNKQTVHVSNLPADSTIDSVTEYFNTIAGMDDAVNAVRLHKVRNSTGGGGEGEEKENSDTRTFDGTAFVELKSVDVAQLIASKTNLILGDKPLTVLMKNAFFNSVNGDETAGGNGKKRKHNTTGDDGEETKAGDGLAESFPTDKLIKLVGLGAESTRESVKQYILDVSSEVNVAYIDYSKGEAEAIVRLNDEDTFGAAAVVAKLTSEPRQLDGATVAVSVVGGDDEREVWKKIRVRQIETKQKSRTNKKQRGGRGGRR